ncbi:chloride channel protein [Glaciihabitans sp. INWT7]|uniref:chloride channel protein n=1 Tax=Glaciihabitans sp. INWT7 TaxID=2596912 RepID=UPI00162A6A3D|nr:chloride channel protein [Glaciihabitans sp. INWT7]QNE45634.1 chloride channel protein [Glaciihabitans sp. INWT7]
MTPARRPSVAWAFRLVAVTALVGIGAGVSGLLVSLALREIEHLAYGYSSGTFLDGVSQASPGLRVSALAVAGLIGGVGWWSLRRWGAAVVSVERSMDGGRMPALSTLANAGLQVIIVGLGASIGREVAPRELGAAIAGWLSEKSGVTARERRILIACGAGAGLAAVYSVPLGGALFAVEILLAEISFATALPALATAAIVARIAVPTTPLYEVPRFDLTPSLFVWALIAGPLLGFAAVGFVRLVRVAERLRPRSWGILLVMPAVFTIVGVIALWFPEVLGNGRALGQTAFSGLAPFGILGVLALVKLVTTTATIGSGAAGGTLTPSLAIGASLGAALGGLWELAWPGGPVAAFAFVAAAAFLASTMRAPFTAIVLVIEFTNQGPALLVPTMLCVAGAVTVSYLLARWRVTGVA